MISVSDILKLLEQLPWWKRLREAPARIDELERRLNALEGRAAKPAPPAGRECPRCGVTMAVVREKPDLMFGPVGVKAHDLRCPDCGEETTRQYSPGKGYV